MKRHLPQDPVMQDAWQQIATAGVCLPHVGYLTVLVIIAAPALFALFGGAQ